MLNENETLDDLMNEAQSEKVQTEKVEQERAQAERVETPNFMREGLAKVPALLTNFIWQRLGLEKLTPDERIAVYDETLKALSHYGEMNLPPWLEDILTALQKVFGPWTGLFMILTILTEKRLQEKRANEARNVTPKPENKTPEKTKPDSEGVEYV